MKGRLQYFCASEATVVDFEFRFLNMRVLHVLSYIVTRSFALPPTQNVSNIGFLKTSQFI